MYMQIGRRGRLDGAVGEQSQVAKSSFEFLNGFEASY